MKSRPFAIIAVAAATILGGPRIVAADVGEAPALNWKCGPNARIEGNLLIVDVPVGEEVTGGLATAELDIAEWDGRPIGAEIVARGECPGVIIEEARGTGGFGYDPHFLYEELNQTFAEISQEDKNRVSHRARAMEKILPVIREL